MGKAIQYYHGEQIGDAIYLNEASHCVKYRAALFRCKCGKSFIARINHVKSLQIRGCGCLKGKESGSRGNRGTHNLRRHPLYGVWCAIKARCYCKKREQYKDYGGRGVAMCDEWKNSFKAFYDWAISNGWKKGLHVDKDILPNKKGIPALLYSPETCCLVSPVVNSNSRRNNTVIEYNGDKKSLADWARFYNINYYTFCGRISRGWSFREAIFGKGSQN